MSYNKNTIKQTEIDAIIRVLQKTKAPYELSVLGRVIGRGINDEHGGCPGMTADGYYEMRRLAYGDEVLLESIYRPLDCDADDIISSTIFHKDFEPTDWKLEIIEEEEEEEYVLEEPRGVF